MAKQERYFIGPSLLSDIRATISRVDAIAPKTSGAAQPVRLQELQHPGAKVFRIATFTGTWNINTDKTVSLVNSGNTNDSRVARNLFASISASTNSTNASHCAIARDGTAWYLIAAGCP